MRASEARKSAIVNAALDCIVSLDAGGRITEFNPAAEATFGRSRDDAIGMPVTDLLIPERLRGEHAAAFERYLQGGEPHILGKRFESFGLRANGEEFPLELTITRVDLPGPPVFTGYLRDLTDSRLAERIARDLAAIVESTEDAILSKTLDGVILTWNRGAELLYGYTADEAIGQPVSLLSPSDRPDEMPEILRRVATGERVSGYETERRRKDGTLVDVALTVSPVLGHGGTVVGASTIARDITDRKRALAQIAHLAYHDQLTGLPNRAMFHEHLELALARADRNGVAVAVLFIDLDNFKLVNDSFGHIAGDALLHDFGQRLKAVTRATDIVARQGGDEFLVLVPDLELHGGESLEPRALEVVSAIEEKVRHVLETPFQVAGTEVQWASASASACIRSMPPTATSCCETPTPRCTSARACTWSGRARPSRRRMRGSGWR